MQIIVESNILEFFPVKLIFSETTMTNLFARKNNKTVAQTLAHKRYAHLLPTIQSSYPGSFNRNLGDFLYELKLVNDKVYLKFLNKYGDGT